MNCYPADERRISDVERGRSCNAILPMPPGQSLAAGDSILFELAHSHAGRLSSSLNGGDSVRVRLTDVTDLGTTDTATGEALFQLSWEPLGQSGTPDAIPERVARSRRSHGKA